MATKLLIYTHSFAPNVGGVETVVMSLATGLASVVRDGDIQPLVVTVVTSTPGAGFNDESLPFAIVRQPGLSHLMRLIRASDVVHLAGPCFLPLLASLLLGKRVVVEHHGFQAICPNGQLFYEPTRTPCPGHFMAGRYRECIRCNAKGSLVRSIALLFVTFPRRWLCAQVQSNITPTNWLSTLLRLPRMATIHHGLASEGNPEILTASSPPAIAFIGRLVGTKGVDVLLKAASRVKAKGLPFMVKIIGDGPERRPLEAESDALGLTDRVQFLGYQPDTKLREVLAGTGIVVVPSLAGEVFGLAVAENMMRGILPIVSSGSALDEVIGNTGLSFPPGDDRALARCLEQILQSPQSEKDERRRAQQRAMNCFSANRMVSEHVALYENLLCRNTRLLAGTEPTSKN
jgi:glycosyltransferase involved in cell wall biosynthesis